MGLHHPTRTFLKVCIAQGVNTSLNFALPSESWPKARAPRRPSWWLPMHLCPLWLEGSSERSWEKWPAGSQHPPACARFPPVSPFILENFCLGERTTGALTRLPLLSGVIRGQYRELRERSLWRKVKRILLKCFSCVCNKLAGIWFIVKET